MERLPITGGLYREADGKRIKSGRILIIHGQDTLVHYIRKGQFSIALKYNKHYYLQFSARGYAPKIIALNLETAFDRPKHKAQIIDISVSLLKYIPSIDYSLLDEPVAIASFNNHSDQLEFDYEYSKNKLQKISALSKKIELIKVKRVKL